MFRKWSYALGRSYVQVKVKMLEMLFEWYCLAQKGLNWNAQKRDHVYSWEVRAFLPHSSEAETNPLR
jgi:hypothetical protein